MRYDLIVLGGGPAGYLGAERAAGAGLRVLLIEQAGLGGVCLNEGCIPTKTLLHSAKLYHYANGGAQDYGVTAREAALDFGAVIRRKDRVVKKLVAGVGATMKKLGVEVVKARGTLKGRAPDGSYLVSAGGADYSGGKLLLCTGSHPALPPIPGLREALDSGAALTNRELLALGELPERLTVIGGGVIGLEMAFAFASFGSRVTVIEMLEKIAGPLDGDLTRVLQRGCEKAGIRFVLGAQVTAVEGGAVRYRRAGAESTLEADKILVSIGRRANVEGVGLERLGVETGRGGILTDERMKTNLPGVFAAGDVNGRSMLAHTGYREAEVAVNVMLGREDRMRYDAIPSVIYTQPEAASIGYTLAQAKQAGLDAREVTLPMSYAGRYVAENEGGDGIAKVVVEAGGKRLLGFHMIGGPASEIISTLSVALEREIGVEALKKVVFPHPTAGEIVRELLFSI